MIIIYQMSNFLNQIITGWGRVKEYNGNLLDQIFLLEEIERVARKADYKEVLEEIDFKRNQINRKLYQKPPMTDN